MQVVLRRVCEHDFSTLLDLNARALPEVNPMDDRLLQWFLDRAAYFRILEFDARLATFLVAVSHDSGYESEYFEWFVQRYERFLYIDRVIVAAWARRKRFAWHLFEDVASFAQREQYLLASDVYSHPPNEPSLAFHRKFGFEQVGTQRIAGGTKVVAKFLKIDSHLAELT
jgi:predicted GNAT superfamily acetyltransferase